METVILKKILHREQEWIGLFGPNRETFNVFVRNNKALWSRTWKCYLLPFSRLSYEHILSGLQSAYTIDNSGLKVQKRAKQKADIKSPEKKKREKDTVSVYSPPFLADVKGLADWELRQQ